VIDVEWTTTLDTLEFDSTKLAFVFDIMADKTTLTAKSTIDSKITEALDQAEIISVGRGRAREVTTLLDEHLLSAKGLAETLAEPLTDVKGIELNVTESVLHKRLTAFLHILDDERKHGTLTDKHVDTAVFVHDGLQTLLLGVEVEGHLRHVDTVDVQALWEEAELLEPSTVLTTGH